MAASLCRKESACRLEVKAIESMFLLRPISVLGFAWLVALRGRAFQGCSSLSTFADQA